MQSEGPFLVDHTTKQMVGVPSQAGVGGALCMVDMRKLCGSASRRTSVLCERRRSLNDQ